MFRFLFAPGTPDEFAGYVDGYAFDQASALLGQAAKVARPVFERLQHKHPFEARGTVEVKGKGAVETWLLRPADVTSV